MEEKRATARSRTLKTGTICFAHSAAIDCIVRNLSNHGAMLEVVSPLGIPLSFVLKFGADSRACSVVWMSEKRIGVAFEPATA